MFSIKDKKDLSKKIIQFMNKKLYTNEEKVYRKNLRQNIKIKKEMIQTLRRCYLK